VHISTGARTRNATLLRALRKAQGWSEREAAQRIGVTHATYRRWERGETWPDGGLRYRALCQFYRVPYTYFEMGDPE
jgi:transcriptional regulator with XRE-family HTH domain